MRKIFICFFLFLNLSACKESPPLGDLFNNRQNNLSINLSDFINSGVTLKIDDEYLSRNWEVVAFPSTGEEFDIQFIDFSLPNHEINQLSLLPFFYYKTKIYSPIIPQNEFHYISDAPNGSLVYGDLLLNEKPFNRFDLKIKWFVRFNELNEPFLEFYSSWLLYPSCIAKDELSCEGFNLKPQPKHSAVHYPIIAADRDKFAVKVSSNKNLLQDDFKEYIVIYFNDASKQL